MDFENVMRRSLIGLSFMVGVLGLSACDAPKETNPSSNEPRTEIAFSVLSAEKSKDMAKYWTPFFADMEKQTGLKVKAFYGPNYTTLVEAMRADQTQAGWFSNVAGLDAITRAEGEVFVHTSYPEGIDGYTSLIIVPVNSKLTIADVMKCNKSLNFGMGDAKSTSGTQAPLYYLFLPAKTDPNTCFKAVKSASHQANMEGVIAGVLDAATNNSTAMLELKANNPKKFAQLKVIWESPVLPNDVIIYRKDLDPATKEKLRSFFLSYGTGTGPEADRQKAILKAMYFGPFGPDDATHFIPIRLMQASSELMQAEHKGDQAAIAEAKGKLAKIEAEKAAIEAKKIKEAPASATAMRVAS